MATYASPLFDNPTVALFPERSTTPNSDDPANKLVEFGRLVGAPQLADQLLTGLGLMTSVWAFTMGASETLKLGIPVFRDMKLEGVFYQGTKTGTVTIDVTLDGTSILHDATADAFASGVTAWTKVSLDAALVDIDAPDVDGTYDRLLEVVLESSGGSAIAAGKVFVLYRLK